MARAGPHLGRPRSCTTAHAGAATSPSSATRATSPPSRAARARASNAPILCAPRAPSKDIKSTSAFKCVARSSAANASLKATEPSDDGWSDVFDVFEHSSTSRLSHARVSRSSAYAVGSPSSNTRAEFVRRASVLASAEASFAASVVASSFVVSNAINRLRVSRMCFARGIAAPTRHFSKSTRSSRTKRYCTGGSHQRAALLRKYSTSSRNASETRRASTITQSRAVITQWITLGGDNKGGPPASSGATQNVGRKEPAVFRRSLDASSVSAPIDVPPREASRISRSDGTKRAGVSKRSSALCFDVAFIAPSCAIHS